MAPRRRIGQIESSARRDMRALPKMLATSGIAHSYIEMARELDVGGLTARDVASLVAEMRRCMTTLYAMAPPAQKDDFTDELQARREKQMREASQTG